MFGRRAFSLLCSRPGGLLYSLPDYLRYPLRFFYSFRWDLKTFSRYTSVHSALEALRLCAVQIYY